MLLLCPALLMPGATEGAQPALQHHTHTKETFCRAHLVLRTAGVRGGLLCSSIHCPDRASALGCVGSPAVHTVTLSHGWDVWKSTWGELGWRCSPTENTGQNH